MNRERKKRMQKIIIQLKGCADELDDINFDEGFAREKIPENLQSGDVYCTSEDYSDKIEDAISDVRQAASTLEEI